MSQKFRILSIDGGGIRGIIPAMVLSEIERRTGKPVCELFDLIAGTSTGGILALGLTKPRPDDMSRPQYAAKDLLRLYETEGHRIFSTSLLHRLFSLGNILDQKYLSGPFDEVLAEFFGDAKLSEALTPVIIPSYEIELRTAFFFKSQNAKGETIAPGRSREDYDFLMRDVARATSSAPTYFEPELIEEGDLPKCIDKKESADAPVEENAYTLIDGGTYANNPAMCAVAEAICATKFDCDLKDLFMVSLGTGEQKRPINYRDAKGWGVLGWAQPILSVVFHGVSDTVNYQTNLILNEPGGRKRHYRLQVQLDNRNGISLDDTRPAAIQLLRELAKTLIDTRDEEIDAICRELDPGPSRRGAAKKGVAGAKKEVVGVKKGVVGAKKGRVAAAAKGRAAAGKARAAAGTRARTRKKAAV